MNSQEFNAQFAEAVNERVKSLVGGTPVNAMKVFTLTYREREMLREMLMVEASWNQMFIGFDTDGVKVKFDNRTWSPGMGNEYK